MQSCLKFDASVYMYDTGFTGTQVIKLSSVDSTNNYAAKLLKESKLFEGTIVIASEQTQGKGQMGAQWESSAGKNLTFSLVLYPKDLSPANHFTLSQVTALAVSDLLMMHGIDNSVKWPNDIYTQNGKICGILIENQFSGSIIQHSIIGVGLNVNQQMSHAPFKATSMRDMLNREHNLDEVLKQFCRFFDKWYLHMASGKNAFIRDSYLVRLLNFGRPAPYVFKGNPIEATITGVKENGILVLRKKDESVIEADLKEISFVL